MLLTVVVCIGDLNSRQSPLVDAVIKMQLFTSDMAFASFVFMKSEQKSLQTSFLKGPSGTIEMTCNAVMRGNFLAFLKKKFQVFAESISIVCNRCIYIVYSPV